MLGPAIDFFDERILAALKDGEPRGFTALLNEVGFSHNTLQQHLERLTVKGLVAREKAAATGFGGPRFAYHVPFRAAKRINAALEDPQAELVAIAFSRLRHVCRFEKGGYCKETRKDCSAQICPQNPKIRIITTLHQLKGQASALILYSIQALPE